LIPFSFLREFLHRGAGQNIGQIVKLSRQNNRWLITL